VQNTSVLVTGAAGHIGARMALGLLDAGEAVVGWKPTRDNLDETISQTLDWERRLHNRWADQGSSRRDRRRP
jgi:nucleoside-diphosphate-sugar epimerase